ncbi:multicopper oxidase domain-containing protein [Nocardia sp. ET3-3]|uniref:Multicopper oxidase domain-containing protein n=1 Tax=Nocardia terrae TaxID=2675851 RepID=A0A7K1V2D0_9NOCA|nr:multicopper oxidase domain-containing protein [Nocardia terrae]MVU80677.1 multicopper oxidase domain-containing protein [Nocardia terrae]
MTAALAAGGWAATRAPTTGADPVVSQPDPTVDTVAPPSPKVQPFVDELPVPPVIRGSRTLTVGAGTHRFHRDLGVAPTWSYGGAPYLGPTIEARAGEPIELTFSNELGPHLFAGDVDTTIDDHTTDRDRVAPRVSVHLHGGVTPPDMDGHAEDTFRPGETKFYRHFNRQGAATLWYHDHAMGLTRLNVVAGLAGLYLLRDDYDTGTAANTLGLPSGEFEMPLAIADRRFNDDGSLRFHTVRWIQDGRWEGGMLGDLITINGAVHPRLDVARGMYRFRVLNASNFREYRLSFSNRTRFWVIGNDSGLLDQPAYIDEMEIAPGERVDIVADFTGLGAGDSVDLINSFQYGPGFAQIIGAQTITSLMRFVGTGTAGFASAPPITLRGGKRQSPALPPAPTADRRRVITLTQWPAHSWPPFTNTLNNLCYQDDPIPEPRQGTTEIWEFVNISPESHPMHLHLVHGRILNRQAFDPIGYLASNPVPPVGTYWAPEPDRFLQGDPQPPHAWETGLKDTITCPAGMVTRVAFAFPTADELGFDPDATFPVPAPPHTGPARAGHAHTDQATAQGYVWHCHLIDHEDECMMSRYHLRA